MNNQIYLTFIILFLAPVFSYAQDSLKYSTLSIGIGISAISNKDQFQSPYTYKGTNLLFNPSYTRFDSKGIHIVDLQIAQGNMNSIVSPAAKTNLLLLSYDYLRNLKKSSRFTPSVGIGLHTILNASNYLPDLESSNDYISGAAFLTMSGSAIYRINKKSSLRMQLGLPLFGLVYRPDFEINGNSLTKTTFIGQSTLFSTKLEYNYNLNRKHSLMAAYTLNYFTFDEPRPITILQNGLVLGIKRTF